MDARGGVEGTGGGVPSGASTTGGSIFTSNNNQNMSAEVSSSYPVVVDDSDDLELGLGLSTGGRGGCRILTAKDFPYLISKPNSSSCSSSSSMKTPNSSTASTRRTAVDSTSVVGWPPIGRAHRMPILANHKSEHKDFSSTPKNTNKTNTYLSVKVNMDGTLIGRKVNLNAHGSYGVLAHKLEDMFFGIRSDTEAGRCSKLLNGTSEFVLTYEDRDGDCMLVGDVPWEMFVRSVKRLRILRNPETKPTTVD